MTLWLEFHDSTAEVSKGLYIEGNERNQDRIWFPEDLYLFQNSKLLGPQVAQSLTNPKIQKVIPSWGFINYEKDLQLHKLLLEPAMAFRVLLLFPGKKLGLVFLGRLIWSEFLLCPNSTPIPSNGSNSVGNSYFLKSFSRLGKVKTLKKPDL